MTQSVDTTLARAATLVPLPDPITTTLPVPATLAFEMFCEVECIPEWLDIIRAVRVQCSDRCDRPQRVAFMALLEGGIIGYTLRYHYDEARCEVIWQSVPGCALCVAGRARFSPLGPAASMLHYELALDGVPEGALPAWADPAYQSHAASAVIAGFRDWVKRQLH